MLRELTLFELKYHLKQGAFWAVVFIISAIAAIFTSQRGSGLVYANSTYAITETLLFISPNIIFVLCVLASTTLTRDNQFKMEPILFTTPMDKFQYLASRYFGIVVAAMLLFAFVLLSMIVTLPFLAENLVGPFKLSHYIASYCIFILPTILLCSSGVFVTAMLSKNTLAVYVAGIVVYIFYILLSILGNSPLMASSNSLATTGNSFSSLLEPYGFIAFIEQSAFWTNEQRNVLSVKLSGNLLAYRLLWLAVSVSLFAYTYHKFSYRAANKKKSPDKVKENSIENTQDEKSHDTSYQAVLPIQSLNSFNLSICFSKFKLEYLTATKGKTFIILMLVTMLFTLVNVISNVFDGPIGNGQAFIPSTSIILELLQQPITEIGIFVAIFYTVELYWNERRVNINSLIDVTPTKNLTFFVAKLSTVMMIVLTLVTISIVTSIGFQLSQGMTSIQPWLYFVLYYYAGLPILLTALFVFSLQRLAKNKAVGLLLGIGVVLLSIVIRKLGLDHPLTLFAYRPAFMFSDMADTIYHDDAVHWYNLYWAAFSALLAVLTVKFWQRGTSNISQKLSLIGKGFTASMLTVFIASGSYIFYQTNVFNEYLTKEQSLQTKATYETNYAHVKNTPQPTVTDIYVELDIFPSQRRYQAKGRYIIENKTSQPLNKLVVSILKQSHISQSLTMEGAELEKYDDVYQTYFYKLNQPMAAGETHELSFEFAVTRNAFTRLDGEHYVTKGGSYIELEDIMPQFGYQQRYVINDEKERTKRGLPLVKLPAPTSDMALESDDWVNFETIVSTNAQQKVVTVGRLQKTWTKGNRNYFHYKSDHKVERQLAYTSAEFNNVNVMYKGVEINLYHSPEHDKDNLFTLDALKHTMDYFSEHYGAYRSNQFTIVELPYFSSAQSFGSAQPGMYLGVENRFFNLDVSDANLAEFNPLLRGVSHEFAHQYWGGYIEPNYVGGYAVLTETLCKYTELVMAQHLYGEHANNVEIHHSIDRYLRTRPYSNNIEKPLFATGMEPHVYYSKGKQTMHALLDLLGEEKINQALRGLLKKHGYPKKPTSLDLLNEFYLVANDRQKVMIDDLFKRVVFHELSLNNASTKQLENGYFETEISAGAIKYVLNAKTNKEEKELINDALDIALYNGFPEVNNDNMLHIQKVEFNADTRLIIIESKHKPTHVKIDPNRYRIDRNLSNNVIAVN